MYRINTAVREMALVTGHFKACLEGPRKSTECVSLLFQPQSAVCSQSAGYSHWSVVEEVSKIQVIFAAPVTTTSPAEYNTGLDILEQA